MVSETSSRYRNANRTTKLLNSMKICYNLFYLVSAFRKFFRFLQNVMKIALKYEIRLVKERQI